ncbi:hypothetical protein [Dactylosporangium sp. NPDC050588]|uniref:poly(ethylene terephthalate) hydrolase family protein n=1 Tax=Dactylosporangium sp. NPDC050588 TaxID=3157211 RepID=UPI0033EFACD6
MAQRFSRRGVLLAAGGTALAGAAGALIGPSRADAAYSNVGTYGTTVNGDQADVYHPSTSSPHQPWPVVLLLQGANVARSSYAGFARKVASYGFVVVVPDHTRVIFGVPGLYADGAEATWTVAWAAAENARAGSPLKGQIDAGTLLLTGHSFGGAAGLGLTTGLSTPPFTDVPIPAPAQLRAAAFYGTNNAAPGSPVIPPVANTVPVALIQGAVDGIGTPANGLGTYAVLQGAPKLYVSVAGANHYGITDAQNPAGARPDLSPQTLNQAAGVENIARWAALWLRAQLGDPVGTAWVYGIGDAVDAGVETQFVR